MASSSSSTALFFALIFIPSIVIALDRAPHGVAYASPLAVSPEAYAFFHPDTQRHNDKRLCNRESECSLFPTASSVQSNLAHESTVAPSEGRHGVGTGAGVLIGLAFAALLALGGVFFVVIKRNRSWNKGNAAMAQPEV